MGGGCTCFHTRGTEGALSFLCLPFAPTAPRWDLFLNLEYLSEPGHGQPAHPSAVISTVTKSNLGSKSSISACTAQSQVIVKGSHGRNPETGADAETMTESCFLACSLWLAQPAFWKCPGPPAQDWHRPLWTGPSCGSTSSKAMAHGLFYRPIWWARFPNWGSPRSMLACVTLTDH